MTRGTQACSIGSTRSLSMLPGFLLIFLLRVARPGRSAAGAVGTVSAPAGAADQLKSASGPVP